MVDRHYDNTYKDSTDNDFAYNMNKCDIKYMLLSTVIGKDSYK